MTNLQALGAAPRGRYPLVRPAYRLLERAHVSVNGLLDAASVLDAGRRAQNLSATGRRAQHEVDILRASIIFTSAGLDTSMRRLVNDVGRSLVLHCPNSSAKKAFDAWVSGELKKPAPSPGFQAAVVSLAPERLVELYFNFSTKSSYQGSGDLASRIRNVLGIPKSAITDGAIRSADDFFISRNQIVHDMDLQDPASKRSARNHRTPRAVVDQCNLVFDLAVSFIWRASEQCARYGL